MSRPNSWLYCLRYSRFMCARIVTDCPAFGTSRDNSQARTDPRCKRGSSLNEAGVRADFSRVQCTLSGGSPAETRLLEDAQRSLSRHLGIPGQTRSETRL